MTRKLRKGYGHPGGARWVDEGWRTARLDKTGDIISMWHYAPTLTDHRLDLMTEFEGTRWAVEKVNEPRTGWERTGTLVKLHGRVVYKRRTQ